MSKTTDYGNALLRLILQAVPFANFADNAAASPATQLWVSLHTADPGEAGVQTTNEVTYPGYGRVSVARSAAGFTVTGDTATFVSAVTFGAASGGSTTAAFLGIGTAASGAGRLLLKGSITPVIPISSGTTPQLAAGSTIKEE